MNNCIYCESKGYIPAKYFGIDTPFIKPEIKEIAGGASVIFVDYGIPCPICNFSQITPEQLTLLLDQLGEGLRVANNHICGLRSENEKLRRLVEDYIKGRVNQ